MDIAADSLRSLLGESEPSVTTPATTRTSDEGWDSLWAGVADEVAGLVRALGIRADRAGDVVHDVYLTFVEKGPRQLADGDGDVRRWLFRVTANRCRLEHRQRSRWQRMRDRLAAWFTPPPEETPLENGELAEQVDVALGRLAGVQREVVVLRYFCGLNSREVGEVLQMPEATVRSHLAKARRQLARDLAAWNEEE